MMKAIGVIAVLAAVVGVGLYLAGYINFNADVTPAGQDAAKASMSRVQAEIHEVTAPTP